LRYFVLAPILLFASVAFANDIRPSYELEEKDVIGRSSSGIARVSNLGGIEITCRIPARPFPTKPGESRNGLRALTNAFEILPDGTKKLVPSEANSVGGGFIAESESVDFYMLIPLDTKEREAEARRSLAKILESMSPDQKAQITAEQQAKGLENLKQFIAQGRLGHFQVECQVMDGSRVAGSAFIEIEVVFRGRISDAGLPSVPIARLSAIQPPPGRGSDPLLFDRRR
jgi:hypothetical protein